ncbi:MAG: aminopeptidase N C-terminal domain-containing protein, partial [Arenicellales bacterium]|nr:aminopeptidase N C-terminal domain-containing protein [Arenicellales bacterium]
TRHPAYQGDNPNKIHALIGTFCHANPLCFHQPDGSGYRLVAGQILDIDPRNPQVAARLVSAFNLWRRFEPGRRALMRTTLEGIRNSATLSRDVAEIVNRALASE